MISKRILVLIPLFLISCTTKTPKVSITKDHTLKLSYADKSKILIKPPKKGKINVDGLSYDGAVKIEGEGDLKFSESLPFSGGIFTKSGANEHKLIGETTAVSSSTNTFITIDNNNTTENIKVASYSPKSKFSTKRWCDDVTTVCWKEDCDGGSGVRLLFEPVINIAGQLGDNRFESTSISTAGLGLEINLWQGYVSFQGTYILPFTTKFDEKSEVRKKNLLVNEDGTVGVNWGCGVGLSFLNGMIAAGYGVLAYDNRDFDKDKDLGEVDFEEGFFFINIQPISAIKAYLQDGS
jgi:hypothetical protein